MCSMSYNIYVTCDVDGGGADSITHAFNGMNNHGDLEVAGSIHS